MARAWRDGKNTYREPVIDGEVERPSADGCHDDVHAEVEEQQKRNDRLHPLVRHCKVEDDEGDGWIGDAASAAAAATAAAAAAAAPYINWRWRLPARFCSLLVRPWKH